MTFTPTNPPGAAAAITVVSDTAQSAQVAAAFAAPLTVEVRDAQGNLVPGATVGFCAPSTGPCAAVAATATTGADSRAQITPTAGTVIGSYSVTASAGGVDGDDHPVANASVVFSAPPTGATAQLAATTVATDASGHAIVAVHAGTRTGSYSIVARVAHGGSPASFALTNTPGAPSALVPSPGSVRQSAAITTAYAAALEAVVRDAFGNPVPGVSVGFTAPAAGATGELSAPSATSDATGQARVSITAGAIAGEFVVLAQSAGLPDATFAAPVAGATAQLAPATAFTDATGAR